MDKKNCSLGVKDIDFKKRVVTGYLSAFNNKDYDDDIIMPGAFTKTIKERKDQIFFLNQHNWKQPHGKFAVLKEDDRGLYFESEPLIDTSYSSDALKLYEAGIVKEHSIGYFTVKGFYDNDKEAYVMKEVKLMEGSNVTLGANPNTPFLGMKSLTLKDVQNEIKTITKAFRTGTFTDETFGLLEIALHDLHKKAFELGKQSLDKVDPLNNNQDEVKSILKEQEQVLSNFIKNL